MMWPFKKKPPFHDPVPYVEVPVKDMPEMRVLNAHWEERIKTALDLDKYRAVPLGINSGPKPQLLKTHINLARENRMIQGQCDVVVTHDHRVYINGHEIPRVMEMEYTHGGPAAPPELVLRLYPTSVMTGRPPKETTEAMAEQPDAQVDLNRAMERAKERAEARKIVGKDTP